MSTLMKRTIVALLTLALACVVAALVGKALGERKMQRRIRIDVAPVAQVDDGAHVALGRYLFNTRGCADCHGPDGAGRDIMRSGTMQVVSPNITGGPNSATASYTNVDWVRTLRHGVKPDGRPVMIMPSEEFNRLCNEDIAALISYIGSLAPRAGRRAQVQLPVAVKVMYGYGMVRDAAELIDHQLAPSQPVAAGVSLARGAYVANSCISCHGAGLSGGPIPGAPPEWPVPANLTPGSESAMVRYSTAEAFQAMLRSGQRPDGSAISAVMPFRSLGQMSEVDVRALQAYLRNLPAREAGRR